MSKRRLSRHALIASLSVGIVFAATSILVAGEMARLHANDMLIDAVKHRDVTAVRYLLRHGADANAHDASRTGGKSLIGILAEVAARHQRSDDQPPALSIVLEPGPDAAGKAEPVELVAALLDSGADPNAIAPGSWDNVPPLFGAVSLDYLRSAALLIAHGADVNAASNDGSTPLFGARDTEMARLLLQHGARANVHQAEGLTPLMLARNASIARLMISFGADPRATDIRGRSVAWHTIHSNGQKSPVAQVVHHATAGWRHITTPARERKSAADTKHRRNDRNH